jgi:arylsulfatase A-like enzyme
VRRARLSATAALSRPHVVIVVVDTLRRDYAEPIELALRRRGFAMLENVVAPAPWTLPSHASMFTGLYPLVHGAHETLDRKGSSIRYGGGCRLCSMLKGLGYEARLFTANPLVHPRFGLEGFDDVYEYSVLFGRILAPREVELVQRARRELAERYSRLRLASWLLRRGHLLTLARLAVNKAYRTARSLYYIKLGRWPYEKGASRILRRLLRTLRAARRPVFAFVNLMEVHEPYAVDEDIVAEWAEALAAGAREELVKLWRREYPRQVGRVAERLAEAIDELEDHGLLSRTLFIVTSDHGQLLGEGGRIGHGVFLDDELLFVPLLLRHPEGLEAPRPPRDRWLSLVDLRGIVASMLGPGDPGDGLESLYRDCVYAESYGLQNDPSSFVAPGVLEELRRRYERYRVAAYCGPYKAVFDVRDWRFTEAKSYRGAGPDEDVLAEVRRRIVGFLKSGASLRLGSVKRRTGPLG